MKILALKTASNETEIILLEDSKVNAKKTWESDRELARDLPKFMDDFLKENHVIEIDAYIGFLGPGSFTGLRIGISTLNALAYVKNKPIVGVEGKNWVINGVERLLNNENDRILLPHYGADANITMPKK